MPVPNPDTLISRRELRELMIFNGEVIDALMKIAPDEVVEPLATAYCDMGDRFRKMWDNRDGE